ncbi:branched-chain amino acid ABC transporter permease, partial [Planktomarina temperata]|nr:branched-chain amino acid ABC transporter permease [Planktomarina temperata]
MMQIIVQGLLLSGLYALIAMGFMLIFSIGRTLNLAYGAYIMVGGYIYFWLSQQLGMPKIVGFAGAVMVGALMGFLKHRLIVKPLKGDAVAVEISTLILAIIMQSVMVLVFGDASKILLPIIPGVVTVAGAQLTYNILAATVMSWIIIAALYAFVRGTHT